MTNVHLRDFGSLRASTMAKTTPTPEALSFLKAHDRIPVYPLSRLLVHLLFALEWAMTDSPSALPRTILFLAATLAIILLTDTLVIRIGKPTSALDFLGQKWTAYNTHLLAFVLVGGAMSVPPDGVWTDARAGSVGGVGFLLVMFALGINISEFAWIRSRSKLVLCADLAVSSHVSTKTTTTTTTTRSGGQRKGERSKRRPRLHAIDRLAGQSRPRWTRSGRLSFEGDRESWVSIL
jgi:hypothetical protein